MSYLRRTENRWRVENQRSIESSGDIEYRKEKSFTQAIKGESQDGIGAVMLLVHIWANTVLSFWINICSEAYVQVLYKSWLKHIYEHFNTEM